MATPPFRGERIEPPPGGLPPEVQRQLDQAEGMRRGLLTLVGEQGPAPALPPELVPGVRDGDPAIPAPWIDLTDRLDLGHLNATSAAARDPAEAFRQEVGGGGAVRTFGLADLQRAIPVFTTPGVTPPVPGQPGGLGAALRGGAEHWIQRARGLDDGLSDGYPDRRAAAATEYIAINLADVLRALVARSSCIVNQPNRLILGCNFPTFFRFGDPPIERYLYALNDRQVQGGLVPGAQLDVSFLVRAHRRLGLDFLIPRPFEREIAAPRPLDADGVFAGTGTMDNRPRPWPVGEASVSVAGAGDPSRVLSPGIAAVPHITFADGKRVNFFVSGGLRTRPGYTAAMQPGEWGRHPANADPGESRSLIDGLDAAGVSAANLQADRNRTFSRQGLDRARQEAAGQLFRFTVSVASLPADGWPGIGVLHGDFKYRYSTMTSVRYVERARVAAMRWHMRTHVFQPTGYFEPKIPGAADRTRPVNVQGREYVTHWITPAGEFGFVVGGFSHSVPRGGRVRWVLESIHARNYYRGLPDQLFGGRFIHPGVDDGDFVELGG